MPAVLPAPLGSAGPVTRSRWEGHLPLVFLATHAAGLAGQAALLLLRAPSGERAALLWFLLPVAALAGFRRERAAGWIDAAALTGSLGGFGMALGHYLASSDAALELCAAPGSGLSAVLLPFSGWSSALMLVACLGCCVWTCPAARPAGTWRAWRRHAFCLVAMAIGMIVPGGLLHLLDWPTFGGVIPMHAAMVTGMMAGAAATHAWLYRDHRYS